ncbi:MAG: hypothetical protein U0936_02670 [Planctomycetaceae bacterium]
MACGQRYGAWVVESTNRPELRIRFGSVARLANARVEITILLEDPEPQSTDAAKPAIQTISHQSAGITRYSPTAFFVAWCQLTYNKVKLAVAAGVVVAVMLMLVQLGIRQEALDNSVAWLGRDAAGSGRCQSANKGISSPHRMHQTTFVSTRLRSPNVIAISEIYMGQGG